MRSKYLALPFIVAVISTAVAFAAADLDETPKPIVDVNSWTRDSDTPADPKLKYDPAENPYDPKKHAEILTVACTDGQVEFTTFPNDRAKPLKITVHLDRRVPDKKYIYFKDPMTELAAIDDPFKRALTQAVFLKIYDPAMARRAGSSLAKLQPPLSADQLTSEGALRKKMEDAVKAVDTGVDAGTFEPDLFKDIGEMLTLVRNNHADILRDTGKQSQAKGLLNLAARYEKKISDAKNTEVAKYVDGMGKVMTAQQKESLIQMSTNATAPAATGPQ